MRPFFLFVVWFSAWTTTNEAAAQAMPDPEAESISDPESKPESTPNSLSDTQRALSLGHQGLTAFDAGKYVEAIELFQEAEGIVHSPVFLSYQARAHRRLGNLLGAFLIFQQTASEELASDAPRTWSDAVAEARAAVEQLREEIPRAVIHLSTRASQPASVVLGETTYRLSPGEVLALTRDPGTYQLLVNTGPGQSPEVLVWNARAFATTRFELSGPPVADRSDGPMGSLPPSKEQALQLRRTAYRRASVAAFSAGGVALSAAAVSFGVAAGTARSIRRRCVEDICPSEEFDRAQTALRYGRLATASLLIASVGAATGLTFLLLSHQKTENSQVSPLHPSGKKPASVMSLSVRAQGLELQLRF